MIILPYKEKFIRENFIEFSFDSDDENYLPDFKLFEKLNTTDQYYLAENYNWDDGVEILKWIIESKKCDKGTASLIFWTSEPDYYFEKSESEISDHYVVEALRTAQLIDYVDALPLRIETDGQKRRQAELLKRLADIEQAIKFLSKPNVLIKMDE